MENSWEAVIVIKVEQTAELQKWGLDVVKIGVGQWVDNN